MAKKTNQAPTVADETPTELVSGDFKVAVETILANQKATAYLLQYGFRQSLQDAVAGMKKALSAEGKSDSEITAAMVDATQKRFDAIMAGTIGNRVGVSRVTGIEKLMRDVAIETLRVAAAAKKVALPKGADLTALADKYIAKHGDAVRAEAEKRQATANVMAGDLDDLLG
jgi:hypothetical protein